ncbi:glycerol acyltransferase [Burkholderia sp. KK1]|uniref:Phospholipid/glycerol acyltransferase n=1 Tax=Caballeronia cordobensis TaxID=1353886 RepID=A0A158JEA8_CABCO|nr:MULTISPECIES: lysophospholipid acyltransferase family protein [Caballeronia]AQG99466.1 glycerol acyltransferase [Burkholderia sp. KK1]BBP97108.1 1-acyl-sn-glycerol-3-phosphate acyltransferase [Burkholderia sp. SFA1]MCE4540902.1 1-acyl-sn-glycerol-3-phosphate acyltransferase [Caballeronia sp. PC1]MCE4570055.1 1-acyl-sn-glycerol-3-phosphate acyltransferase [Caballeronia sp. CLC5]SAL66670.1 phospholipid/glycerol acyltransferase [Caballeronia cordobensis]
MWLAWRKLRLLVHLLRGMWLVATRFPRASAAERMRLNRAWSIEMLRLAGMKLVVHNDEARLDAGALVVGNHISWIDIYVINAWRPTPFVSKAEIRKWPVVGWLAHQLDTVFVQREKRSDAKRIMHELAARLDAGELMCVFPEGTTTDGRSLLPFHANMFQAAVSASCPVQPICLMYEDAQGRQSTAPAYIGDMTLNDSLSALLRATPLTAHLYVCDPLAPGADRRLLASEAQAAVDGALQRMRGAPAVVETTAEAPLTSSSSSSPA